MANEKGKSDKTQDADMIRSGVRQHEMARHSGEPRTTVKLKKGGPTGKDRMTMGRGMSRAANQKTG